MLKAARYVADPHTKPRNHKIPLDVIEYLTGKRDNKALDNVRCLFEVIVHSGDAGLQQFPPVQVKPASSGEVYFGKKALPDYPESFGAGSFLIVQITKL